MDRTTKNIIALTIAAGILYGFGLGTIVAVAMPYLERTVSFSAAQLSGLVAAAMVGSVVMTPLAGPLVEWIGRRRAIGYSALLFAAGAPVVCFSGGGYWMLFGGLLVQGLAMGVQGLVIPLYLAEMLPKDLRGKGTGLFQLCLIGGVLGAVFHHVLHFVTHLRLEHTWLVLLLPIGGLLSVAWYRVLKLKRNRGTNEIIDAILDGKPVSPMVAPVIFLASSITHLFGGSAGREGAALQLGGSPASLLAKLFRLKKPSTSLLLT